MKIKAESTGDTLDVFVYGAIGGFFDEGMAAKDVAAALAAAPTAKTINVRINSPGGDVFEGVAIYNLLKSASGRVVVTVDGLAASGASLVAMAGADVRMAQGSMMMIHEASVMGLDDGRADGLREKAKLLDTMNDTLVAAYLARAEKAGKTREDVVAAMSSETWFTADEAIAWGHHGHVLKNAIGGFPTPSSGSRGTDQAAASPCAPPPTR